MAKVVIGTTGNSGFLSLGGTDYSDEISEASLALEVSTEDATNFASAGWAAIVGGIKSATLNVTFKKDSDLSGLDSALFTAFGTSIAFVLRRDSGAASAANAEYGGSVVVNSWGVELQVGSLFGGSVSFPSTGAITRATA